MFRGSSGGHFQSQVTSLLRQKSGNPNPESLGKVAQLAREQTPKHVIRPLYVPWGLTAVLSRGHRQYKAILWTCPETEIPDWLEPGSETWGITSGLASFCQVDTNLDHLRNCFYQIGPWACLWSIFFLF